MADYTHTIDSWDDATGENLIDQIAAVGDYLVAVETYPVKRWPTPSHASESGAVDREKLGD